MRRSSLWVAFVVAGLILQVAGCGGNSGGGNSQPQPNPVPSITGLSPSSVAVGAASQTLTINGANFMSGSAVEYNGTAHNTTYVSSAELTISLSSSDLASIGSFSVVVTNPMPGGGNSNSENFVVEGGTLSIQIINLPAGTPGNVSITSASGFNKTISSNQALQLPPARYTITANAVETGNLNYYADPVQQSVNLTDGSSNSIQVPYTIVIPTTTKILDQVGLATLTVSNDGSTLTMSEQSAVAASLAPGDTLVAQPARAALHGLLRKVTSVVQSNGQIVATTTQGTLADAIQQANVQLNAVLLAQNIQSAQARRPGVTILRGKLSAEAENLRNRKIAADSSDDICSGSQIVVTEMTDTELVPQLDTNGEIELCGDFQIQGSINWQSHQLNSLTATVTFAGHTEMSVTGEASIGQFSQTETIATVQFDDILIFVGPVPVDLVPEVDVQIGANGNVGASFTEGVIQNASVTGGFSYSNGQVSPILQTTPLTFQVEPISVDAGLTATAFIAANVNLLFYDIAGPYFTPEAYLQFDANVVQNPWWTLSGGLQGPTGLELNPELEDIFGFENLPQVSFPDLFNENVIFAQATGGFLPSNAAPSLSSVSPNTAAVGSANLTLTLTGENFVPGATANFNAVPLATSFVNATEITAVLPSSDLMSAGTFPVTATNPDTSGATSGALNFAVVATPTVTVSPSSVQLPVNEVQQFAAAVTEESNTAVTWSVNGVVGGNSSVGTITLGGAYTAPAAVPSPATVTVTATSQADSSLSGSARVTVGPYTVKILYSFTSLTDGAAPSAPLIQASDGFFYGTTQLGGSSGDGIAFKVDSSGNVTPLHEFSGGDGSEPLGALIEANDGNFYGTTNYGGASDEGTIFKMDSSGDVTTLYSFTGGDDGGQPLSGLTLAGDGYFYGTTFLGGTSDSGTVFRVDSSGDLTSLYSFSGGADGFGPEAPLIQASDGYFYGVTQNGGNLSCEIWPIPGCGTIFKVNSSGSFTTLYSFSGGPDGANPVEALLQANDGSLYGTSVFGGDASCSVSGYTGCGSVFKIDSAGNFTTMHDFSGGSEGGVPFSSIIQASDGDFYGTATAGGDSSCSVIASGENFPAYIGCGTVFKMDAAGNVSPLYSFAGSPDDGSNPFSALLEGSDGYFYGTTRWGGSATCSYTNNGGCGTVFRVAGPGGPLPQSQNAQPKKALTTPRVSARPVNAKTLRSTTSKASRGRRDSSAAGSSLRNR